MTRSTLIDFCAATSSGSASLLVRIPGFQWSLWFVSCAAGKSINDLFARSAVLRAVLGVTLFFGSSCGMAADDSADEVTPEHVDGWIRQLGAESFLEREIAGQRLLAVGRSAIRPLEIASRSADREIRERSRQILALLRRMRRDEVLAEFRQADGAGAAASAAFIPGWSEFSNRYGDGSLPRTIYAEMLHAEWDLLSELFAEDGVAENPTSAVARRFEQIQRSGSSFFLTSHGTVLTMFTLAALYPDQFNEHGQLFSLTRNPDIQRPCRGAYNGRVGPLIDPEDCRRLAAGHQWFAP